MIAYKQIAQQYKPPIWAEMETYFHTPIDGVSDLHQPELEGLHWELAIDYPQRGGKYVRPILLLLAAEAMGATVAQAVKTAAAMEISENWLLIHDDFEDGSLKRRGQPTLHLKYTPELAINAGDTLHVMMWKILRDNEALLGAARTFALIDEFYRMLSRTALGQTVEIRFIQDNRVDLTEADYLYMVDGKTSYYTIAGPMRLGAIVAVDDAQALQAEILPQLNQFGCQLGRAFQTIDDLLDLTTDFEGLKQKGNDVFEGKRTLPLIHMLQQANETDRAFVLDSYGKPREDKTQAEVDQIIRLMADYGSLDYARQLAHQFADQARATFAQLDFLHQAEARQKLAVIIDFVIDRQY